MQDLLNLDLRKKYLEETILSISGWRRVFADDASFSSSNPKISIMSQFFVFMIGDILSNFFQKKKIIIGMDSRATGEIILSIIKNRLIEHEILFESLGVTALPQCVAYTAMSNEIKGFIYISASHNPCGYNGFKVGDEQGLILNTDKSKFLIETIQSLWLDESLVKKNYQKFINQQNNFIQLNLLHLNARRSTRINEIQAAQQYEQLLMQVLQGPSYLNISKNLSLGHQFHIANTLKNQLSKNSYKIIYDFNGSSRLNAIDTKILEQFNISTIKLGSEIGKFTHEIVPEGNNLKSLKDSMLLHQDVLFGIAVDCDGDRGSLALYQENLQQKSKVENVIIPHAQDTFFLCVLSELAFMELFYPEYLAKTVVIANGPTSIRINRLCNKYGVHFDQAEVGEANVVDLALQYQKKTYYTRIIGEGSNGGNITPPSQVRDPLSTIFSLLKLLFLSYKEKSLIDIICQRFDLSHPPNNPRHLISFLLKLNKNICTTSSFAEEGIIKVKTKIKKNLKLITKKY